MDSDFWDQRYAEPGYAYGTQVNVYLASHADLFKPGQRVLVIGDGEGRNGVWLAQQGLEVLSVDQSAVGLAKAAALAQENKVALETLCIDVTQWNWPREAFDHVVLIFVHFPPGVRARMHHQALAALKPGGTLIMESFTYEQLSYPSGGPPVREMLYDMALLQADFSRGEILELEEQVVELQEGKYHHGKGAVVRLLCKVLAN